MKSITVKSSYDEVTIEEYMKISEILNSEIELVDKDLSVLEVLTGKTFDELKELPASVLNVLTEELEFLNEEIELNTCPQYVTINGKKYEVIRDIGSMESGRYVDIMYYMQGEEDDQNIYKVLPSILKADEDYKNQDNAKLREEVLNMNIIDALSISSFFLACYHSLIKSTADSLVEKKKEELMSMKMRNALQEAGLMKAEDE